MSAPIRGPSIRKFLPPRGLCARQLLRELFQEPSAHAPWYAHGICSVHLAGLLAIGASSPRVVGRCVACVLGDGRWLCLQAHAARQKAQPAAQGSLAGQSSGRKPLFRKTLIALAESRVNS